MNTQLDIVYRFKILVVGDSGVGKTSLIRKFSVDKFDNDYTKTDGTDFNIKSINTEHGKISITIWDFSGENKFEKTRKYYYYGAHAAFIVFDVTNIESFNNIEKWYNEILYETGSIPVIILANKSDKTNINKINIKRYKEFSNKHNIELFFISAKNGINLQIAFLKLINNCLKNNIDKYNQE